MAPGFRSAPLIALAAASALAVLPTASADAARHHAKAKAKPCTTAAGKTLAASAQARVYMTGSADDGGQVYSCWLSTKKRGKLVQVYDAGEGAAQIGAVTIAGRYAAFDFEEGSGQPGETTDTVDLVDLKTGKLTRTPAVAEADGGAGVTSTLPTPGGVVLWTGSASDCAGLHAFGPAGAAKTVSCGAVSDVAAAGQHVYWTQDGQPRSAPLG